MDNYFKCKCGKELLLHPINQTDCSPDSGGCGRSYWRAKDESGKLYALVVRSPESDFKDERVPTYTKAVPLTEGGGGMDHE